MAGQFYNWSKTAASNATADSTVGWAEGQPPSSINDSARALMASTASWRDDISGTITTGGTSTALTITSNQAFDSLAHMNGAMVAFVPHTTNGATVTLNVDGLGAKPLRSAPSVELPAGVLVQGTVYSATYNNSDAAWYLHNFYVNPYQVPLGAFLDYSGSTSPNAAFAIPNGQAISRTTYSAYFALVSTTYGAGNGTTTFNIPDCTGRVTAMQEASATRLTSTYFGGNSTVLGATGGSESHTLTTAQLAAHSHGVTDPGHTHTLNNAVNLLDNAVGNNFQGSNFIGNPRNPTVSSATTGISINNTGSGNAHNNVQPTIVLNKILRIL